MSLDFILIPFCIFIIVFLLRRENIKNPYEILKDLTRGNKNINEKSIKEFIKGLPVDKSVKKELLSLSPKTYLGNLKND